MNGKPGDRPLPDGSGNFDADGNLRDLDAENPSQAEKMRLGYPEDVSGDRADDTAAENDPGPGDAPPPVAGGHGHSGEDPQPSHGNDGDRGHQFGGSPGKSGESHGKSGQAPGHNK